MGLFILQQSLKKFNSVHLYKNILKFIEVYKHFNKNSNLSKKNE